MSDQTDDIRSDIDKWAEEQKLSPAIKKRKLIIWVIRTLVTVLIYYMLWEYNLVRWTLLLYVPLAVFNLVAILGFNFWIDRKVKKAKGIK